jgi:hypothetical protein
MFQQQFQAEGTLLNDSNNNGLLNINLADGYGQTGILIPGLHKCVAVGCN